MRKKFLLGLAAAALLLSGQATSAQSEKLVVVSADYANNTSTVYTFAEGDPNGQVVSQTAGSLNIGLSPDGQYIAITGYDSGSGSLVFDYGPINGGRTAIPMPTDHSLLGVPVFDSASSTLLYATVGQISEGANSWTINLISLADGSSRVFNGSYVFEQSQAVDGITFGVASPIAGWDPASSVLLLRGFIPFADGNFTGLFALDLINAGPQNDITEQNYRVLPATGDFTVFGIQLNSNWKQGAGVFIDPNNPLPGFVVMNPYPFPLSGIKIFNIESEIFGNGGEFAQLALPQARGVSMDVAWDKADNLYFVTGEFRQGDRMFAMQLARATGTAVTEIVAIDAALDQFGGTPDGIEICGNVAYVSIMANTADDQSVATLYSIGLGAGNPVTKLLEGSYLWLNGCVAG
jgi:hypothetical protein